MAARATGWQGHGLADRVVEVNRRAAELAREAAGWQVTYLSRATWGPPASCWHRWAPLTPEEVADAYAEQAAGLAEGGADFLLIETMSDLGEAQAAIEGARRVTDLPIFCTFSFDTHGRTMMGVKPGAGGRRDRARWSRAWAPTAAGIRPSTSGFLQAMRQAAPGVPSCGPSPTPACRAWSEDEVVYDATPEYMGQIALQLARGRCADHRRLLRHHAGTHGSHGRGLESG